MDTKNPAKEEPNLWDEIDGFFKESTPTTNRIPSSSKQSLHKPNSNSKMLKPAIPSKRTTTPSGNPSTINRALHVGGGNKMAENRIQIDLNNIPGDETWFEIPPPDPNNLFFQEITIIPPEGYWKNCHYKFRCQLPKNYPFAPPSLHCDTLIYHPNIDLSGNVCITILKEDGKLTGWTVQRSLSDVLFGLLTLFSDPNPADPLNEEASNLLAKNPEEFKKLVNRTLKGETVLVNNENRKFEKLI